MTPRQIFQTLDAISRTRALSEVESRQLERAMAALDRGSVGRRTPARPWEDHELEAVRLALRPAKRGRPRLGEESMAPALALALGRSTDAVEACMHRLRREDQGQLTLELRGG